MGRPKSPNRYPTDLFHRIVNTIASGETITLDYPSTGLAIGMRIDFNKWRKLEESSGLISDEWRRMLNEVTISVKKQNPSADDSPARMTIRPRNRTAIYAPLTDFFISKADSAEGAIPADPVGYADDPDSIFNIPTTTNED